MSAYGEFKNRNYVYVAFLHLKGNGVVDLVERHDLLQAIDAYNDLLEEAQNDTFGEGIYEASLYREFFDEKGRVVKSDLFRSRVIDRGDEI